MQLQQIELENVMSQLAGVSSHSNDNLGASQTMARSCMCQQLVLGIVLAVSLRGDAFFVKQACNISCRLLMLLHTPIPSCSECIGRLQPSILKPDDVTKPPAWEHSTVVCI